MALIATPQPNIEQHIMEENEDNNDEKVQLILSRFTIAEQEELIHYFTWLNYRKEPSITRRRFKPEEDDKLKNIIMQMISKNKRISWNIVSQLMGDEFSPRQCKERWTKYLSPDVSMNEWTKEEDNLLFALFNEYGAKWTKIAPFFKGRTDINVKNRWVTLVRRSEKEKCGLFANFLEE